MGIRADLFELGNCDIEKVEEVEKNGKWFKLVSIVYSGEIPGFCPKCGSVALHGHGNRIMNIIDTPFGGLPAILAIKYPRKRCKDCGAIWSPSFPSVDEMRKMTKRAFVDIAQRSLRNTFEDVTNDYMISDNTVQRVFIEFMKAYEKMLTFKTPAFLGIDEIKIKKLGEITVITDLEHRTLFDMFQGRNQEQLTEYFKNLRDREKVLWVCSDMYRPFEKSISSSLPNAKWAIDHFHVVMKANEAVDTIRRKIQDSMDKKERIQTKRGLAYTLKMRRKDLTVSEGDKIKELRASEKYRPLAIAFDLKEDFFDIYDENKTSKDNALQAFEDWEKSIPKDEIYEPFRELAKTVKNFKKQIFQYWDCPIAITNGFTECTNRLIRENNMRGRGYSFEVLRGRTLFRKENLSRILENGLTYGPAIQESEPNFHFDGIDEEELPF